MHNIPNTFQKKTLWMAVTAFAIAVLGTLAVGLIYLIACAISFLQPLLVPFAVAGVLAYLLEPVVARLMKWGLSRLPSVWLVFGTVSVLSVSALLIIVPLGINQGAQLSRDLPGYTRLAGKKVTNWITGLNEHIRKDFQIDLLKAFTSKPTPPSKEVKDPEEKPPEGSPAPDSSSVGGSKKDDASKNTSAHELESILGGEWLEKELPVMLNHVWGVIKSGLGGFLGVFGFLLSLFIVPLYLYYFLTEAPKIKESWHEYVPLRSSMFKDQVVETLTEINRYLIAFFRGQLVVSMINGLATAIGLSILGLNFGWLIGLALCFLGIIPYLGIALCWLPAVIIASVQKGSWLISADAQWWVFVLWVTGVFALVQKIDSFFISPRVVGERVGLHPMTVIASVFAWSLVFGGLLGAILAVPMTASLKVLFQRYVWQRAMIRDVHEGGRQGEGA